MQSIDKNVEISKDMTHFNDYDCPGFGMGDKKFEKRTVRLSKRMIDLKEKISDKANISK